MNADSTIQSEALLEEKKKLGVKCVVWDLDDTLWNGTLLEGGVKGLQTEVLEVIRALDRRGILQSIASKNEHAPALAQLEALGIAEYFLYPQINWGPKSASIERIAKDLNIGIDTLAFIDDQTFELDEVRFALPQVMCIPATEIGAVLARSEFIPRFITEDSGRRRAMYMADITRNKVGEHFNGPQDAFLASLDMRL